MVSRIYVTIILITFSSAGIGAPVYYTFSGSYEGHFDGAGQAANWGDYTNPETVYGMTWLVDTDRIGTALLNDGSTRIYTDATFSGIEVDYFFADLIDIQGPLSLVQEIGNGFANGPNFPQDAAFGSSGQDADPTDNFNRPSQIILADGPTDQFRNITCESVTLDLLAIGTNCKGAAQAYDESGNYLLLTASLTLQSISSDISVVPLPATIWLFGTALAGLMGFQFRQKRKAGAT